MKKVLAILGILILLFVGYVWFFYFSGRKKTHNGPPPVALKVGKHSAGFNQSIENAMTAYYGIAEGMVQWDTATVTRYALELRTALDSIKLDELKADTTGIYESAVFPLDNAKGSLTGLINAPSFDEKKNAFVSVSENLRDLLFVVNYETGKIYWQECPTSLGEDKPAGWLSKTEEPRNPYLGLKHPVYKETQLNCGEMKFVIPKDSTRRD